MLDNNGVHPITYTAKTAQKAYKDTEQAFKFELEEPQKVEKPKYKIVERDGLFYLKKRIIFGLYMSVPISYFNMSTGVRACYADTTDEQPRKALERYLKGLDAETYFV
jgi:hypothetical protein